MQRVIERNTMFCHQNKSLSGQQKHTKITENTKSSEGPGPAHDTNTRLIANKVADSRKFLQPKQNRTTYPLIYKHQG